MNTRLESLKGVPHEKDLAKMGGYRNKWAKTSVSCYQCDFLFEYDEIHRVMNESNISFIDAGYLTHAKVHPWCKILLDLDEKYKEKLLGNIYVFT